MSVSVIVVGHGDEPVLDDCLRSIVAQVDAATDDVVLVDHGITRLPSLDGVALISPLANTGFGGGCNAGAEAAQGDVLVFVNSDAVLRPGAIDALAGAVQDPAVGLAGGLVLLPGDRDVVNSMGLPVHISGLSWCDGYGEPVAARHLQQRPIASVAGALFACRRDTWDLLGGMDASYFMYHEDTDLSLRCQLAGLEVVHCPQAVAVHAYEFSRNRDKMFYLERNRFLTVFGDYPRHLLVRAVPVLIALEPLFLAVAVRDGWGREKVRAWWWLGRHTGELVERRRRVQGAVRAPRALDCVLTPAITQTQLASPVGGGALNTLLRGYWRAARMRTPPGLPSHARAAEGRGSVNADG